MPTARELLEQADALMRRNRSPMLDDIPVLTDSIGAIPPSRIARPRPAPPRAPEPAPPRAPEPAPSEPDTIPTLTGAIAPAAPVAEKREVVEEGEPSDWLQLGEGEPSAIGEAPDSIAIVPQVEAEPPAPEPPAAEEIEITASAEEADEAFDEEIAERTPPPAEPAAPAPSAASLASSYAQAEAPIPDTSFIDEPTVTGLGTFDDDVPTIVGKPVAEAPPQAAAPAEPPPVRAPEPIEDVLLGAPLEAVSAQAADAAAEEARWSAMAEEIRMQVLQRIDLFTDTGLREQLGARLQPIVDRASADLVATINQHVGELLRAYVAEAIEREIESWRQNRPS
jgi:hypothetical protein